MSQIKLLSLGHGLSHTFRMRWFAVKGEVVPVLNQAPCHEDVLGEWRYSSMHS